MYGDGAAYGHLFQNLFDLRDRRYLNKRRSWWPLTEPVTLYSVDRFRITMKIILVATLSLLIAACSSNPLPETKGSEPLILNSTP
jgi:hypothetical protein